MIRVPLTRSEALLLLAVAALLALALGGPFVAQPAHAHDFADQRALWGVPCALDVLSNLAFAVAALVGGWRLARADRRVLPAAQWWLAALFFAGLFVTAFGSAWYHLRPDDAGLLVDRLSMALAFSGLLGLLVACTVTARAGSALGLALLLLAPAGAVAWFVTGNVLPWALVQFGGMVMVMVLAWRRPREGALDVRWGLVILAYAVAKMLETADGAVFAATGEWVAGHTLKHLVAALAAWPVIAALGQVTTGRQNAARNPGAALVERRA